VFWIICLKDFSFVCVCVCVRARAAVEPVIWSDATDRICARSWRGWGHTVHHSAGDKTHHAGRCLPAGAGHFEQNNASEIKIPETFGRRPLNRKMHDPWWTGMWWFICLVVLVCVYMCICVHTCIYVLCIKCLLVTILILTYVRSVCECVAYLFWYVYICVCVCVGWCECMCMRL